RSWGTSRAGWAGAGPMSAVTRSADPRPTGPAARLRWWKRDRAAPCAHPHRSRRRRGIVAALPSGLQVDGADQLAHRGHPEVNLGHGVLAHGAHAVGDGLVANLLLG